MLSICCKFICRLFKTALLFVGKDYYCHALWDQYIKFEYSQQNWSSLANIYLEVLRHPTGKLREYYDKYVSLQDCYQDNSNHTIFIFNCMVSTARPADFKGHWTVWSGGELAYTFLRKSCFEKVSKRNVPHAYVLCQCI